MSRSSPSILFGPLWQFAASRSPIKRGWKLKLHWVRERIAENLERARNGTKRGVVEGFMTGRSKEYWKYEGRARLPWLLEYRKRLRYRIAHGTWPND